MMTADPYLAECVVCRAAPCVPGSDACVDDDCQGSLTANDGDHFGRCYHCRWGDHTDCIGVPCQCPCPTPDVLARRAELETILNKLDPYDRARLTQLFSS
jgi:hypothetical protein